MKDVKFVAKTENSITLLWKVPDNPGTTSQNVLYDIKCNKCPYRSKSVSCNQPCGRLITFKPSQNNLMSTHVTIEGLEADTEYVFVIYSKNENSQHINMTHWARFEKKIKTEGRLLAMVGYLLTVYGPGGGSGCIQKVNHLPAGNVDIDFSTAEERYKK